MASVSDFKNFKRKTHLLCMHIIMVTTREQFHSGPNMITTTLTQVRANNLERVKRTFGGFSNKYFKGLGNINPTYSKQRYS